MKFLNSIGIFLLWPVCFVVFIFIFLNESYSTKFEHIILPPSKILDQVHAGEVTAGFRIEQSINWNLINTPRINGSDSLCINILLANYMDRKNSGSLALSLQTEKSSQKIILAAKLVRNNLDQRFCYDKLVLKDFLNKPATLLLEGIDSPPDQAITAWLTSDTAQGNATRNGVVLDKSLIFSIDAVTESNRKRVQTIILTILAFLSTLILFSPQNHAPNKTRA